MRRVVVLGRGGSGKSTLARRLSAATGLPVVELDALFWRPGPIPTPPAEWAAAMDRLVAAPEWIVDGDLGPYDVLPPRLRAADTVVVLELSLARCAWRAVRRSREGWAFWRWMLAYRRRWLPRVRAAIASDAPDAEVHVFRNPAQVRRWMAGSRGNP